MNDYRLDAQTLISPAHDARLLSLADELANDLSTKMMRVPGMTPQDQIQVQMLALSKACSVACTTIPGTYEQNARSCADVVFHQIMAYRKNAEAAATRAYTLQLPKEPNA